MSDEHSSQQLDQRSRFWAVIDERLGLSGLAYPVPEHANRLPHMLGGITLFGFVVLVLSGVLLAQFYDPSPAVAHQSVIYIVTQAPFGDFLRGVHFWMANLVVVTVLLHMIRVFVTGSYKRPREANWLIGVALFAVTVGFVFTGTVLKWDQEAIEALAHNREIAELLGLWGVWFSSEFTISTPLLTRLYLGHVTLLPAVFTVLIIAHLYLVKMHGISSEATEDATTGPPEKPRGASSFTTHLVRMTGFGLLLFVLAGVLALVSPAPLGQAGVPGAEVTKPPWMFLPFYPLEEPFGIEGLFWSAVILFGLLALVPFVDRSNWRSPRRRKWIVGAGAVVLVVAIALGLFAGLSPTEAHLG